MNIPMSWIYEYVDINGTKVQEFTDKMTMIGQKVEDVTFVSKELSGIVTGKILKLLKHPSTDKWLVADVDINEEKPLTIVTGATNVYEGAIVPIVVDKGTVAGGKQINGEDLRGVTSNGMMCSVQELGFTHNDFPESPENGIYIFEDANTPVGADVCELLQLRQDVVEYEITSNRPDCFSVTGIAREASAAFNTAFKMPDLTVREEADGLASEMIDVKIEDSVLCPRYIGRVIKDVKIEPSPLWLRRRLTSAGIRPINNIVDITNYVMLEMGQPMHAFDLDVVAGGIIVKTARNGEKFTTLDGVERVLDSTMLVIADHKKTIGIAGVMGGENSMITGKADAVLLESACFDGTSIRLTAKKIGLRTDASSKFEKGLDPNLAELAVNRAAHLIELLNAGKIVKGLADCYPDAEAKKAKKEIPFEFDKINALLGLSLTAEEMAKLLVPFEIEINGDKAIIPTFRPDLELTADLAEEVARAYGYDKIEPKMIVSAATAGKKTYKQTLLDKLKDTMSALGFYEAITYSFESPDVLDKLLVQAESDLRKSVSIVNPLGESYSVMRTTAMNGLLTSLSTNYNKRNTSAYLYEIANIYLPKQLPVIEQPEEKAVLAAGFYGVDVDFYTAKGYLETIFDYFGISGYDIVPNSNTSWLHPGRSGDIYLNGETAVKLGFIGEVHPTCLDNYSIGKRSYVFQIDLECLYENANIKRRYNELPKYPSVQRDIAVLVSEEVTASQIQKCISKNGGQFLCDISLFDVYKGEQVSEGMKSVAYSLVFRSHEKTLSENDVTPLMNNIVNGLKEDLKAELRS